MTINGEQLTEVLYAGAGYHQPIFHIDMFVSLTGRGQSGRYRVLVGSPAEADRLLGAVAAATGAERDLRRRGARARGAGLRRDTQSAAADVRRRSAGEGALLVFATSNNCLVQIDDAEGEHVWLPTYGHGAWSELAATDDANRHVWEELGFTVHQLADFNVFAENLGSVHCIKKYLARVDEEDEMRNRSGRRCLVGAAVLAVVASGARSSKAAFPGNNGSSPSRAFATATPRST